LGEWPVLFLPSMGQNKPFPGSHRLRPGPDTKHPNTSLVVLYRLPWCPLYSRPGGRRCIVKRINLTGCGRAHRPGRRLIEEGWSGVGGRGSDELRGEC
jgi:hypothetical protein